MSTQTRSTMTTVLPAPSVNEADENNHVAATVNTVTVVVPVWSGMAAGDRVDMLWNGNVTGEYTDYVPVTAAMISGNIAPTFSVPSAQIATNNETAISYVVTPVSGDKESSDVYTLSIGEVQLLPAPSVDEAEGTTISVDDNPDGVTVTVPATANLVAGDVVTVYWAGADGSGTTSVTETVSGNGAGQALTFHIAADVLSVDAGTSVQIYYTVTHASGSEETSVVAAYDIIGGLPSDLPAPTMAEADSATMTIDPANVAAGITVIIPATAGLVTGDNVSASVQTEQDGIITTANHAVTAAEAGKALSLTVQQTLADDADGDAVTVWYSLTRAGTATKVDSDMAVYRISITNTTGRLLVMGARTMLSYIHYGNVNTLVSLNADTLQPMEATWQYDGENDNKISSYFRDVSPERNLFISSADDKVKLNTSNFCCGMGGVQQIDEYAIFSARLDDGSVMAWGEKDSGGMVPDEIASLNDIVSVNVGGAAIAALRSNGSVIAWGDSVRGGEIPIEIAELTDIVALKGGFYNFAALRSNGSVVTWGQDTAITVPSEIASLSDIVSLAGTIVSFAALRNSGSVVAWGDSAETSTVPDEIAILTDIISLMAGIDCFVALRSTGSVVAWGDDTGCAKVPAEIAGLTDIVSITIGQAAIAALRGNGSVVAWGHDNSGGSVPADIASLTDIVSVTAGGHAFAALRSNGSVVAWGNDSSGGSVPTDIASLTDIVSVVDGFAALRSNGTVVTWGNNSAAISDNSLVNYRAVNGVQGTFMGLTDDSQLKIFGKYSGSANGISYEI